MWASALSPTILLLCLPLTAVRALDHANVSRGVILSCAYLYGLPSLHLKPRQIAALTRRENEFTAAQVAQYPTRLVGFLSVNPLQGSAIDEIRHWQGSRQLIGLKLHFTASAVDMRNGTERRQGGKVIAAAAAERIPIVIHLGGGKVNAADAELFIRDVPHERAWRVVAADRSCRWRLVPWNREIIFSSAARIRRPHRAGAIRPRGTCCLDLSSPCARSQTDCANPRMLWQSKCGESRMKHFLFGSDFNVLTPQKEIADLRKLGRRPDEGVAKR